MTGNAPGFKPAQRWIFRPALAYRFQVVDVHTPLARSAALAMGIVFKLPLSQLPPSFAVVFHGLPRSISWPKWAISGRKQAETCQNQGFGLRFPPFSAPDWTVYHAAVDTTCVYPAVFAPAVYLDTSPAATTTATAASSRPVGARSVSFATLTLPAGSETVRQAENARLNSSDFRSASRRPAAMRWKPRTSSPPSR